MFKNCDHILRQWKINNFEMILTEKESAPMRNRESNSHSGRRRQKRMQPTTLICSFKLPNRALNFQLIKMRIWRAHPDCFQYAVQMNVFLSYCPNQLIWCLEIAPETFCSPLSFSMQENYKITFHLLLLSITFTTMNQKFESNCSWFLSSK